MSVVFGQEPRSVEGHYPEKLIINYEDTKERVDKFQRFQEGPAAIHKVGRSLSWYEMELIPYSLDIMAFV